MHVALYRFLRKFLCDFKQRAPSRRGKTLDDDSDESDDTADSDNRQHYVLMEPLIKPRSWSSIHKSTAISH